MASINRTGDGAMHPSSHRKWCNHVVWYLFSCWFCGISIAFDVRRPGHIVHSDDELSMATEYEANRRCLIQVAVAFIPVVVTSVLISGCRPSEALSPEAASTAYDTYASTYDDLDGGTASSFLGIKEARSQLLKHAHGKVLEVGVGTGLNLAGYNPSSVSSLTLVDISEGMLQQAKRRVESLQLPFPIDFVIADATSQLVDFFGESAFDTCVDSFSLCVMGSNGARNCVKQLTNVVKSKSDGGRILLLENSRSSNPLLGAYQDVTAEAAASAGGKGCVYNQDVGALIRSTRGLVIEQEISHVAGLFRSYVCFKST